MHTIAEFLELTRISRTFYYRLQARGEGPAETRIGTRVLIAKDTAAAWIKSREKQAARPS